MKRSSLFVIFLFCQSVVSAQFDVDISESNIVGRYFTDPLTYPVFAPITRWNNGSGYKEFDTNQLGADDYDDVFWDRTNKRLTPLGYYMHRLSESPDFMIQHLKNILDDNGKWIARSPGSETIVNASYPSPGTSFPTYTEWSGPDFYWNKTSPIDQIPDYKSLHRIFRYVAIYRLRMREWDGAAYLNHSHSDYPHGAIWASAVEGFLKSRLFFGRISNADKSKSTHLAMQFHLIYTLTNNRFVEEQDGMPKNPALWSDPSQRHPLLGIDITNIWNLDEAQNLIDQIMTKSSMIEPSSGLWQAVEIVRDRPSVHASWDALRIVNDLHYCFTIRFLHEAQGGPVNWNGTSVYGNGSVPAMNPDPSNPYKNVVNASNPYVNGTPGNWIFKKWYDSSVADRTMAQTTLNKFLEDLINSNESTPTVPNSNPQYYQGTKNDNSGETWNFVDSEVYTYGRNCFDEVIKPGVQSWFLHYHMTVDYPSRAAISWQRNTAKTILWTCNNQLPNASNVKIELLKGGAVNLVISASTPNDGSHSWTVPSGQAIGNDYKIRITSTADSSLIDASNNNFSIVQ